MKRIILGIALATIIATQAGATSPLPWNERTSCIIMSYNIYIKAQQKAATDGAALSAQYIPESAKMAEAQRNLRLLETEAEKLAFVYLAERRQADIPLKEPVSKWLQAFTVADKQQLVVQSKEYAATLEKLVVAKAENDAAIKEWNETENVKAPAGLQQYQNDLLDIGRELNLKTREAETHCAQ